MKTPALLGELLGRGIRVRADGERLRLSAPAGALTPELREELRRCKPEILAFLRSAEAEAERQRAVVPLQPRGALAPIFGVGGHNGDVFCYRALARHLGDDRPLYGLEPPGLDGHSKPLGRVDELAAYFAGQVRSLLGGRACIVAGYCAGGSIAFELARQLRQAGVPVDCLALLGAPFPARYRRIALLLDEIERQVGRLIKYGPALAALPRARQRTRIVSTLRERRTRRRERSSDPWLKLRAHVERATILAVRDYVPAPYPGRVCLFLPSADWAGTRNDPLRWRSVAEHTEVYAGPQGCGGDNMLAEPHVAVFAELLRAAIAPRGQSNRPLAQARVARR